MQGVKPQAEAKGPAPVEGFVQGTQQQWDALMALGEALQTNTVALTNATAKIEKKLSEVLQALKAPRS